MTSPIALIRKKAVACLEDILKQDKNPKAKANLKDNIRGIDLMEDSAGGKLLDALKAETGIDLIGPLEEKGFTSEVCHITAVLSANYLFHRMRWKVQVEDRSWWSLDRRELFALAGEDAVQLLHFLDDNINALNENFCKETHIGDLSNESKTLLHVLGAQAHRFLVPKSKSTQPCTMGFFSNEVSAKALQMLFEKVFDLDQQFVAPNHYTPRQRQDKEITDERTGQLVKRMPCDMIDFQENSHQSKTQFNNECNLVSSFFKHFRSTCKSNIDPKFNDQKKDMEHFSTSEQIAIVVLSSELSLFQFFFIRTQDNHGSFRPFVPVPDDLRPYIGISGDLSQIGHHSSQEWKPFRPPSASEFMNNELNNGLKEKMRDVKFGHFRYVERLFRSVVHICSASKVKLSKTKSSNALAAAKKVVEDSREQQNKVALEQTKTYEEFHTSVKNSMEKHDETMESFAKVVTKAANDVDDSVKVVNEEVRIMREKNNETEKRMNELEGTSRVGMWQLASYCKKLKQQADMNHSDHELLRQSLDRILDVIKSNPAFSGVEFPKLSGSRRPRSRYDDGGENSELEMVFQLAEKDIPEALQSLLKRKMAQIGMKGEFKIEYFHKE